MGTDRTDAGSGELTEVYRGYFDPDGPESVSVGVVGVIADALDQEPTGLPPVREVLDLDHLDGLFVYGYDRSAPDETSVRFPYLDHLIEVWGDGQVNVYRIE